MPPTKLSQFTGDSTFNLNTRLDVVETQTDANTSSLDTLNTVTIPGINSDIADIESQLSQSSTPNSRATEVGGTTFSILTSGSVEKQVYDCTLGNGNQELPDATLVLGKTFTLTRTGSGSFILTINPRTTTSQKIANSGSFVLTERESSVTLVATLDTPSGAANWRIISNTSSFLDASVARISPTVQEMPGKNMNLYEPSIHAMVLKLSNGQLVGWGDNSRASLGTSLTTGISTIQPVVFSPFDPPESDMVVQDWCWTGNNLYVLMGNSTKGWVYGCGQNAGGQLGLGDTTVRSVLTRIDFFMTAGPASSELKVTQVWAAPSNATGVNYGQAFFQCSNGEVYACGWNVNGQFGHNPVSIVNVVSTPVKITGFGTLPASITIQDVLFAQTGGTYANYILTTTGALYAAGVNTFGNLGDGTTTQRKAWISPSTIGGGAVVIDRIRMGHGQGSITLQALKDDGTLYSWGQNTHKQVTVAVGNQSSPQLMNYFGDNNPIVDMGIFGGFTPSCWALDTSGYLWTWGYNSTNNLFQSGTGTPKNPATKITALGTGLIKIFGPSNMYLSGGGAAINNIFVQKQAGSIHYSGTTDGAFAGGSTLDDTLSGDGGATFKTQCRVATTANITLSGTQTIDGIAVVVADRVLVKNQTTGSQNGIYVCASGTWTRATDHDTGPEILNSYTSILSGTVNAGTKWVNTNSAITLDVTAITFSALITAITTGVKKMSLPHILTNPNSDGFDQIKDVIFNYGSTLMTMFVLTNKGRLFSFGNNTTAVASGGNDSTSNPVNLYWCQIKQW